MFAGFYKFSITLAPIVQNSLNFITTCGYNAACQNVAFVINYKSGLNMLFFSVTLLEAFEKIGQRWCQV